MDQKVENRITVGTLKMLLSGFHDDDELYFGGLEFYRLKDRGAFVQVEFSETLERNKEGQVVISTQI